MVKAGVDDETVIHAIRGADALNFDLSPAGEKALRSNGVSVRVVAAMKTEAERKEASSRSAIHKGLTNTQVVTMVKAGMDDETIMNAIRGADAIDFDLSPGGQQQLEQRRRERPRPGCDEGPGREETDSICEAGGGKMMGFCRFHSTTLGTAHRFGGLLHLRSRAGNPLRRGAGSGGTGARADYPAKQRRCI